MSNTPLKIITNVETGETQVIPLTQEEIDVINAAEAEQQAKDAAEKAKRDTAVAKLEALGLTEEDIRAILK